MPSDGSDDRERWTGYARLTADRPPRKTVLLALDLLPCDAGPCLDLGCGAGRDAIAVLKAGRRLTAIDRAPGAIAALLGRSDLDEDDRRRLTARIDDFTACGFPPVSLLNASFSLFLCPPARFPTLWTRMLDALLPAGIFAGHLLGDRDGWADRPGLTLLPRGKVEDMLRPLAVELFEEEDADGATVSGVGKRWHLYHIVARKRT